VSSQQPPAAMSWRGSLQTINRMGRPALRSLASSSAVPASAGLVVLAALTWPLLLTSSGFSGDWNHHLWLMWHQSLSIQLTGYPSFFLNSSYSVLYPVYAFYGGTLYVTGAMLSLALGGAPTQAYVLIYLLDFAASLAGWYWLARMAGVGRWTAFIPGLIFVTSTYYLLVAYAEGDWPEFTGTSMIPLMVAAALCVLHSERLRIGAFVVLAGSATLFFGSHNLTIILGLTMLAFVAAAVVACVPSARRLVSRRGTVRLAAIVLPAGLVSAWYLLPTLAYVSHTHIGIHGYSEAREFLSETAWLVAARYLFTFSRSGLPGSLPVLAIAWVLAGIVVLPWRNPNRIWLRLLLVFCGFTLLIGILMTHVGLLLALPAPYTYIQFSYRLEAYLLMMLSASILAALALARRGSRRMRVWTWLAIPVCIVSAVGGVQQVSEYPNRNRERYATLENYGEIPETRRDGDYEDASAPTISTETLPRLEFPSGPGDGSKLSVSTRLAPGTLALTNIAAGPYLLHISGAQPVAINSAYGYMVVDVGSNGGRTGAAGASKAKTAPGVTQTITVSPAHSLPIVLGRVLSAIALAVLALELLVLAARPLLARVAPGRRRGAA
jgi:hypothetical protein